MYVVTTLTDQMRSVIETVLDAAQAISAPGPRRRAGRVLSPGELLG
jgi:hypothetical protein